MAFWYHAKLVMQRMMGIPSTHFKNILRQQETLNFHNAQPVKPGFEMRSRWTAPLGMAIQPRSASESIPYARIRSLPRRACKLLDHSQRAVV